MAGAGWPSESHRYGKGLCVVLGDKAVLVRAFVGTLNHQSGKSDFDLYIHNIIIICVLHTSVSAIVCCAARVQEELMILCNLSYRPPDTLVLHVYSILSFLYLMLKIHPSYPILHFMPLSALECVINIYRQQKSSVISICIKNRTFKRTFKLPLSPSVSLSFSLLHFPPLSRPLCRKAHTGIAVKQLQPLSHIFNS